MKTEDLTRDLHRAAAVLRQGGLVAVPTETVYGLAGNGLDGAAVDRIYRVKGRPEVKPLSLLVPDDCWLDRLCRNVPLAARTLAKRFWPGPLTLVLPSRGLEPEIVRAGGNTVALRCPDHPLTRSLLAMAGVPLATPSANPSGEASPRTAEEVLAYFDGRIEGIVDGGESSLGRESTIFDLSRTPYRVLRAGALPEAEILAALRAGLTLVGITGGSGCGKTTALRTLEKRGALILDADSIYHELTRCSGELRGELTERFGDVYSENGLDRKKLAGVVFSDPAALEDLNGITHKYVLSEIERRLTEHALAGGTIAAVDAVALMECGLGAKTSFNVAVTAPAEDRITRLTARDGIPVEAARARIGAQKPEAFYRENCDFVLHNDGDRASFETKCDDFFQEVLRDV